MKMVDALRCTYCYTIHIKPPENKLCKECGWHKFDVKRVKDCSNLYYSDEEIAAFEKWEQMKKEEKEKEERSKIIDPYDPYSGDWGW